jgi:hypothetical protein
VISDKLIFAPFEICEKPINYNLTKYGIAIKITPTTSNIATLVIKYGKTISAKPEHKGTIALCFLPYIQKPIPMLPNKTLQIIIDELSI